MDATEKQGNVGKDVVRDGGAEVAFWGFVVTGACSTRFVIWLVQEEPGPLRQRKTVSEAVAWLGAKNKRTQNGLHSREFDL